MSSEEYYLNSLVTELAADLPKIDASVKNLAALMMTAETTATNALPPHAVMTCARMFLKAIQSHELLDMDSYCRVNPQGANQPADDRLSQVCRYKVLLAYRKSIESKDQKVSQQLGKLFFVWSGVWREVRDAAYQLILAQNMSAEQADAFLGKYENSLFATEQNVHDADLIWATNFNVALRERQQKRAREVQNRLNDIVQGVIESKQDDEVEQEEEDP
ncbi:hypothetical protein EON65_04715 [archaeon]|nr:MAG: hypothetical protein EON65_04715 [archaeon]